MSTPTFRQFVETLQLSGLADALDLDRWLGAAPPDTFEPDTMLSGMVREGALTEFQKKAILAGKGKELLLGSYLLLELIGEGGMGEVYKARHIALQRLAALKIIRRDLLTADNILRFQREAQLAATLDHPHIVRVYDAGQAGDLHYYAMEYLEGTTLSRLVRKRGPLSVADACTYVRQAALGLHHAHEAGLVHRDVKPSNLMLLSQHDQIKVLDLGLAFQPQVPDADEPPTLTRPFTAMGTADYMAPEQTRDAHGVDRRADIYSLGCTLYFLVGGEPPFPGGDMSSKLKRHQEEMPTPLSHKINSLPRGLDELVESMLAKDPAQRPQTAAEAALALAPWCGARSAAADSATMPERQPPASLSKRRLWVLVAAGALALGLALFLFLRRGGDAPEGWIVTRRQAPGGKVVGSIRAALDKARPGERILVVDENHEEALEIGAGERGHAVTIEAAAPEQRVTWRPPADHPRGTPLIKLHQVENLTLKGFVLDGQERLDRLIVLSGACPGLRLEDLHLRGLGKFGVVLDGLAGAPKHAAVFQDVRLSSGPATQATLAFAGTAPNQFLRFERCRFEGPCADLVSVGAGLVDVLFEQSRFFQARHGLHFRVPDLPATSPVRLVLKNNTFCDLHQGLVMDPEILVAQNPQLDLELNLFVNVETLVNGKSTLAINPNVRWIHPAEERAAGGSRFYRTSWVQAAPKTAELEVLCDESFQVWHNGDLIGKGVPGKRRHIFDLAKAMEAAPAGQHFLAFQSDGLLPGRGGLLAQLHCDAGPGRVLSAGSNGSTWQAAREAPADWQRSFAEDKFFRRAAADAVAPLSVTGALGNLADGCKQGDFPLAARTVSAKLLSRDPEHDKFLHCAGDAAADLRGVGFHAKSTEPQK